MNSDDSPAEIRGLLREILRIVTSWPVPDAPAAPVLQPVGDASLPQVPQL